MECNLILDIYSTDRHAVDPVFFAVVPDSFMTRETAGRPASRTMVDEAEWDDERDQPLIAPNGRWSF
jgi:hypothetical protein